MGKLVIDRREIAMKGTRPLDNTEIRLVRVQ